MKNEQDRDLELTKEYFLRTWKLLLKNLLFWPDEKIEKWITDRQWEKFKAGSKYQSMNERAVYDERYGDRDVQKREPVK